MRGDPSTGETSCYLNKNRCVRVRFFGVRTHKCRLRNEMRYKNKQSRPMAAFWRQTCATESQLATVVNVPTVPTLLTVLTVLTVVTALVLVVRAQCVRRRLYCATGADISCVPHDYAIAHDDSKVAKRAFWRQTRLWPCPRHVCITRRALIYFGPLRTYGGRFGNCTFSFVAHNRGNSHQL